MRALCTWPSRHKFVTPFQTGGGPRRPLFSKKGEHGMRLRLKRMRELCAVFVSLVRQDGISSTVQRGG